MRLRRSGIVTLSAALITCALAPSVVAQVNLNDWPRVHLEVVGTDAKGDLLQCLTADQVSVWEQGHSLAAEELKPTTEPMSLCILLDSSGSMYESLDMLRRAVERLLKELPAEDDVCIADFSNAGYIEQNLTTDREADLRALGYMKAAGGTALYDMLSHLADYMRNESHHASRAIILFSDGDDNASTMKQAALEQEWTQPGTPAFHVVAIPQASFMEGGDKKHAIRLARMGGGLVYFPRKAQDLLSAVDHVNEAVKTRYLLTYSSDNQSKDGRVRQVDVALDKAHLKARATISAPQGYYAPSR